MRRVAAPVVLFASLALAWGSAAPAGSAATAHGPSGPASAQDPDTGTPPAAWDAARTLPDGPERTDAIVRALAEDTWAGLVPTARRERLEVAYLAFVAAEARFAADELLALAEVMYARDRALWSAFCLEGALRRGFGRYAEADELLLGLQRQYEAAEDAAAARALVERRALVASGAGEAARELALLGRALGSGSADARQILGFAALRAGDTGAALAHFEVLLAGAPSVEETPPPARDLGPWALRGYGVALLPPAAR